MYCSVISATVDDWSTSILEIVQSLLLQGMFVETLLLVIVQSLLLQGMIGETLLLVIVQLLVLQI